MKLSDLYRQLGVLIDAGWGDCLVIDRSGNDVTRVSEPGHFYASGDPEVLLDTNIDYDLRREMGKL